MTWAEQLEKLSPFAQYVQVIRKPGQRTYIELRAPVEVAYEATMRVIECPNCGDMVHPFRERHGDGGRQKRGGGIFFAASCGSWKPECSRTTKAGEAFNAAADFFSGTVRIPAPAECAQNAFTGLHIPVVVSNQTICKHCGARL